MASKFFWGHVYIGVLNPVTEGLGTFKCLLFTLLYYTNTAYPHPRISESLYGAGSEIKTTKLESLFHRAPTREGF
ncbi:hypothetical protein TMatcc_000245 [Talaromyces marneffei ATCC 18224]